MNDISQIRHIIGTQFWAGSQDDVPAFLLFTPSIKSVVCLRRDVPEWWLPLQQTLRPCPTFVHAPVPSINEPGTETAILAVLDDVFPAIALPSVFFCLKGRNRTGMLAGVLRYTVTHSLDEAVKEYQSRAGSSFRDNESRLLQRICSRPLKNPLHDNHDKYLSD